MQVSLQLLKNANIYKSKNINQNSDYIARFGAINPFEQLKKDTLEISFKANRRGDTQNFEVKNIPNLRCPACGLIMLDENQIAEFVKDVSYKKGQDLHDALEKYEDESVFTHKPSKDKTGFGIYRPSKKVIVDIYKKLALEFPDKNLLDLTKIQAKKSINPLIEKQMVVIDELREYIEQNMSFEQKRKILETLNAYIKQIKGETKKQFRRKVFITNIRNSVDYQYRADVEKIVSKMPTSENNTDSFFVKYANSAKSSNVIAIKLVEQSKPTAEHVVPRALGGSDSLSNYICDCAECNVKRQTTPFYEWYKSIPDFQERLQEYIDSVSEALDNGIIVDYKEYDEYIRRIIGKLVFVSKGEIYLELPEMRSPKRKEQEAIRRKAVIERISAYNNSLIADASELQEELKALENSPFYADFVNLFAIEQELASISKKQAMLASTLDEISKEIKALKASFREKERKINSTLDLDEKNKLKQEYIEKERRYCKLNEKYERLTRQLGLLDRRKNKLFEQKSPFEAVIEGYKAQYENLRRIILKVNQLAVIASGSEDVSRKEKEYIDEIALLEERILELKNQNASLVTHNTFSVDDIKEYEEYTHYLELSMVADKILSNRTYEKISKAKEPLREIIQMGRESINLRLQELKDAPTVKYFINLNLIKDYIERKVKFENDLSAILRNKKDCEDAKVEINRLLEGRELSDVQNEYERLSKLLKSFEQMPKIEEKKAILKRLNKQIEQNNIQLAKLENYESMTRAQFAKITDYFESEMLDNFSIVK